MGKTKGKSKRPTRAQVLGMSPLNLSRPKRSQEEMVGFVLIIVIVMIGLMVFLVISLRKSPEQSLQSKEIENLLSSLLKHTTDCAIVYEPDYDDVRDLIKSCYQNKKCTNLDKDSCEYLNETLNEIMPVLYETHGNVNAYKLEIVHQDSAGDKDNLLNLGYGNCTGKTLWAQEKISVDEGNINVKLMFCYV